jgi:hypothetical protein
MFIYCAVNLIATGKTKTKIVVPEFLLSLLFFHKKTGANGPGFCPLTFLGVEGG